VKTEGDRFADARLTRPDGRGVFVKEIQEALLSGRVDLGVHSLKDLPTQQAERHGDRRDPRAGGSPRRAGVAKTRRRSIALPKGALVATGSPRRRGSDRRLPSGPEVSPRCGGTSDTRGRKAPRRERWTRWSSRPRASRGSSITAAPWDAGSLPTSVFRPPGQVRVALESRAEDGPRAALADGARSTRTRAADDRGARVPLRSRRRMPGTAGALARVAGERLSIDAVVATPDGARASARALSGARQDAVAIGLRGRGGDPRRRRRGDRPGEPVRVLVTRPAGSWPELARRFSGSGIEIEMAATTSQVEPSMPAPGDAALARLATYSWIVRDERTGRQGADAEARGARGRGSAQRALGGGRARDRARSPGDGRARRPRRRRPARGEGLAGPARPRLHRARPDSSSCAPREPRTRSSRPTLRATGARGRRSAALPHVPGPRRRAPLPRSRRSAATASSRGRRPRRSTCGSRSRPSAPRLREALAAVRRVAIGPTTARALALEGLPADEVAEAARAGAGRRRDPARGC
jgi:hydroxymethylbilane synthase